MKNAPRSRARFFDMDGLLLDSERACVAAFNDTTATIFACLTGVKRRSIPKACA